jgi:hypothetical protein
MNFLKNAYRFAKDDLKNRPLFFLLETSATLLSIIAAITLASLNEKSPFVFVWALYLYGSLVFAYIGYVRKSTNIMILMMIYTIINTIGIINSIIN